MFRHECINVAGSRLPSIRLSVVGGDASLLALSMSDEPEKAEPAEWGQKLVKQFFLFPASGEMDQCLAGFAPAAQAHLIDQIEAVQSLLEEFIAKH